VATGAYNTAQTKFEQAATDERTEITRGLVATKRLQRIQTETRELESRVLDAVFSGDDSADVLTREHAVLLHAGGILRKAIAIHESHTLTDARRATLDAELVSLDAEILVKKLDHALLLNDILTIQKRAMALNGGEYKLDAEQLFTGRIRDLQLEVFRLEDRKISLKRKLETHNADALEMRAQYTRNFQND